MNNTTIHRKVAKRQRLAKNDLNQISLRLLCPFATLR